MRGPSTRAFDERSFLLATPVIASDSQITPQLVTHIPPFVAWLVLERPYVAVIQFPQAACGVSFSTPDRAPLRRSAVKGGRSEARPRNYSFFSLLPSHLVWALLRIVKQIPRRIWKGAEFPHLARLLLRLFPCRWRRALLCSADLIIMNAS